MKCPREGRPLAELGPEGRFGMRCTRCDGALFSERRFMRGTGHDSRLALPTAAGLASLRNLPEGGCACPRDGGPMRLLRYRGVEIDVCIECGSVWVDAGELAKIAAIVRREQRQLGLDRGARFKDGLRAGRTDVGAEDAIDVVGFIGEALGSLFESISF